jgi:hypothetical protein
MVFFGRPVDGKARRHFERAATSQTYGGTKRMSPGSKDVLEISIRVIMGLAANELAKGN